MVSATMHHIRKITGQTIIAAICAVVFDALVYSVFNSFYSKELNFILKPSIGAGEIISTILAYLVIGFSIAYFVIPGVKRKRDALLRGAVLGLVLGAVYDLPNYAILVTWSAGLTLMNIVGCTLAVALISVFVLVLTERDRNSTELAKAQPGKKKTKK